MALTNDSLNDGEGRYGSRTRVNRLVYEFTQADLATKTTAFADVQLNGKIHNVVVDPTRSKVGSGNTTGKFQLLMGDLLDGAGSSTPYAYCEQVTAMDYGSTCPAPYQFQTTEGGAQNDSSDPVGATICNNLILFPGVGSGGGAPAHSAGTITTAAAWTGLVCGTVRIQLETTSAWAADTGSIFVVLIYE